MSRVYEVQPRNVTLEFRQDKTDSDYGSCLWATFTFDLDKYTMQIMSDCGNYSYGWTPTPEHESFKHLLGRLDEGYLLYKLSDPDVFDDEKSLEKIMEYLGIIADDYGIEMDEEFKERIETTVKESDEFDFVDDIEYLLKYTEFENKIETYEILECLERDYSGNAKKIVQVFMDYIRPVISAEEKEWNSDHIKKN